MNMNAKKACFLQKSKSIKSLDLSEFGEESQVHGKDQEIKTTRSAIPPWLREQTIQLHRLSSARVEGWPTN